jgi:excinuclease ABC subunit A
MMENPDLPIEWLSAEERSFFIHGSESYEQKDGLKFRFLGIAQALEKLAKHGHSEIREEILPMMEEYTCPACQGTRLNPLARAVTLHGTAIGALVSMPILQAIDLIRSWPKAAEQILGEVTEQLLSRLQFLAEVGVGYLAIERRAPTLSGGEMQRLRLARQLGSSLTGVLYVLDEPTIGLHPKDIDRLSHALGHLQKLGNTLLLVEHDPLLIAKADYILDFGPLAGAQGGHITARGTYEEILDNPQSLTGQYLSGQKVVEITKRKKRIKAKEREKGKLQITGASKHNLKNIAVKIPTGCLTVVSGVSGSGKSTLMEIIQDGVKKGLLESDAIEMAGEGSVSGIEQFDKLVVVDQNPIGHTSRSDVGTYVELLPRLRELFCQLPQAKILGLQPAHFSANHRRGMCTTCWGLGYKKVEMYFLPDIRVECEGCRGLRLNPSSLSVLYKGKNFGEYLKMSVEEARVAFESFPRVTRLLDTLIDVGLAYLMLGQEMASLSGGEAQRIKLSRELGRRATGKTLYLLDEPTTGLHSFDIAKLLSVLDKLVEKGNSVIAVEHNLDFIRSADWIIELGPEGGLGGGYLLCEGTLEQIKKNPDSATGPYLTERS